MPTKFAVIVLNFEYIDLCTHTVLQSIILLQNSSFPGYFLWIRVHCIRQFSKFYDSGLITWIWHLKETWGLIWNIEFRHKNKQEIIHIKKPSNNCLSNHNIYRQFSDLQNLQFLSLVGSSLKSNDTSMLYNFVFVKELHQYKKTNN